jgi:hypothetical protein
MAKIEIEIGDDGAIGTLPEPLQKFVDKRIDEAYQKGADKAEKRLSPLTVDPKELERLRTIAKEAEDAKIALLERDKNYEEAQKIRDKRHQDELDAERQSHGKTKTKIRELVGTSIRAAAVEAGARSESLDELERLIGADVDLDGDLNIFVKGADGQPLVNDKGEKVTLEGYVQSYLDKKPHHKAGTPAKGGKAPGGAALRGAPARPPSGADALRQAIDDGTADRSTAKAFVGNVLLKRGA